MTRKKYFNRFIKILGKTLIVLCLIFLSAQSLVDLYQQEILNFIGETLEEKSAGVYEFSYDKAGLDLFKGVIFIKNLSINLDKSFLLGWDGGSPPGKTLAETVKPISLIRVKGFSIPTLLFGGGLRAKSLWVHGGELNILITAKGKDLKKVRPLPQLRLGRLEIEQFSFRLIKPDKGGQVLSLPGIDADIRGLELAKISGRVNFDIRSGCLHLKNPEALVSQGFYTLRMENLTISKSQKNILVENLELMPRYGKYEFARLRGYRTSRVSLKIPRIDFVNVDLVDIIEKQSFGCGFIRVSQPQVEILRDRHLSRRRNRKIKSFPQQFLEELGFTLSIDSLELTEGNFIYEERALERLNSGSIHFAQIDLNIHGLYSNPDKTVQKGDMTLDLSSKIMNRSLLQMRLALPLGGKKRDFSISGSLAKSRLRYFNSFLTRNAAIRIDSGEVEKIYFSLSANPKRVMGEMRAYYRDLKVSLLKKGKDVKKRKFLSFLANSIIHKHNTGRDGTFRVGKIYLEPDEPLPFFSYIFKGLLSGVKSSIGLKRSKKN